MSDGGAAFWAWRAVSRFARLFKEIHMQADPMDPQIEQAKPWILQLRRREQVARTTRL